MSMIKPVLKTYGMEADQHWKEVMDMAERYGFIVQAYGGIATLFTHHTQLKELGEAEYLRIQQMDGHCPRDCGYPGCLTKEGVLKDCGSCWADKRGAKWVRFKRNENRAASSVGTQDGGRGKERQKE